MINTSAEECLLIETGNFLEINTERRLLETLKRSKGSINWDFLLENAEKNYIVPQVYNLFANIEKSYISPIFLEKLEKLYLKAVIRDLQAKATLKEIFHVFKEIKFVLMKGHTIGQYYPEQTIRSSIDVDILVSTKKTFKEACKKLIQAGYELLPPPKLRWEQIKHLVFVKKDRIIIELHKDTQWAHYRVSMNKKELFQSALISKIENKEFLVVSPENNILLICTRLLEEGFFIIRDLIDTNVILSNFKESIDWKYLLERAKADNLDLALFCLLYLSSHLYTHELVPEKTLKEFKKQFNIKFLFALLIRTRISLPLLWNSNIRNYFLIYSLRLKFKQDLKFFIYRVRKFGFGRELWNLISDRFRHPVNLKFLKKLFP